MKHVMVGGPPDETYSVTTHPERFAPLQPAIRHLLAYLEEHYEVTRSEGPDLMPDAGVESGAVIRLTPADPSAGPLTVSLTRFPGLVLRMGAWLDFPIPVCGCDARDDRIDYLLDDVEQTVFSLVNGGFREQLHGGRLSHWLERADGSSSGTATIEHKASARLKEGPIAPPPDGRWHAWTPREAVA